MRVLVAGHYRSTAWPWVYSWSTLTEAKQYLDSLDHQESTQAIFDGRKLVHKIEGWNKTISQGTQKLLGER